MQCGKECAKDCAKDCKEESGNVERYTFEATLMIAERTIRRIWILSILLIVLLVGTNGLWIYHDSQLEDVVTTTTTTQTVTQDAGEGGNNNFVGGNYGNAESENNDNDND